MEHLPLIIMIPSAVFLSILVSPAIAVGSVILALLFTAFGFILAIIALPAGFCGYSVEVQPDFWKLGLKIEYMGSPS